MTKRLWRNEAATIGLALSLLALSACASDLKDVELIEKLESNKATFEQVVALAQETEALHNQTLYTNEEANATDASVAEVQNLLKELNIHSLYVLQDGDRVDFVRYDPSAGGFLYNALMKKGYIYFREPTSIDKVLRRENLDEVRPSPYNPFYKIIDEHWHLYLPQSPD